MEKKKKNAPTFAEVGAPKKTEVSTSEANLTQISKSRLGRDLTLLGAHSRGEQ